MFPSHRALPHQMCSLCLIALRPNPSLSSFPFFDINHLLLWALWGCGRRASVVQAQRQIHRAFGKAGVTKPSKVSVLKIDQHRHGYRQPPPPWGTRRAGGTGAVCPTRRRACRRQRSSLGRRCEFWAGLRFIVYRYVTIYRQAGIIRLRHGAPRRLFPATLVACPRRSPDSISLRRRSQRQAPPLRSRRPVAARLLAATL
jgi:hypothetical protein